MAIKYKKIMSFLFIAYILLLIELTLIGSVFGRRISFDAVFNWQILNENFRELTNFTPFSTIEPLIRSIRSGHEKSAIFIANIVINIVLFMPFSIFLPYFFKKQRNILVFFLTISIINIVIEILQFVFSTGSCDIDDYILNICGAMVVYLFPFFHYLHKKLKR